MRAIISGQALADRPVSTTLRQQSPSLVYWDNGGGAGRVSGRRRSGGRAREDKLVRRWGDVGEEETIGGRGRWRRRKGWKARQSTGKRKDAGLQVVELPRQVYGKYCTRCWHHPPSRRHEHNGLRLTALEQLHHIMDAVTSGTSTGSRSSRRHVYLERSWRQTWRRGRNRDEGKWEQCERRRRKARAAKKEKRIMEKEDQWGEECADSTARSRLVPFHTLTS